MVMLQAVKSSAGHRLQKVYDSDRLMLGLWKTLCQDFRSAHGTPEYAAGASDALDASVANFRKYKFPDRLEAPVFTFKTEYQLENLFKRYVFKEDAYTDMELEERTNEKFLSFQKHLATRKVRPAGCYPVLQYARKLVRSILGPYSLEEHMSKCRFGKRACKGTPARNAYLDSKLGSLSGSHEHIRWFYEDYLPTDPVLSAAVSSVSKDANPLLCTDLDMTNVPKSWKIKRGICPNTSIGSFYTYGLGALIQDRLDSIGLRITKLQRIHGRLAKRYSRSRSHVTADLSNASNSFYFELLCQLLPRDWLRAVKFGRIRTTNVNGSLCYTESFMLMGIGYTFTLQTLLFHSLIKAVQHFSREEKGIVSVYGDDLIYPRSIHDNVRILFESLGFQLNEDKTFVQSYFRESCGSDFYRGSDVRPFQPEGVHQMLKPQPFVLKCYQIINGLLARWDEKTIPQTIRYLVSEILRVDNVILQVPPHFPDYSGFRVYRLREEFWLPWVQPTVDVEASCDYQRFEYKFLSYIQRPHKRPVLSEYAYYWESLRSSANKQEPNLYDDVDDLSILAFVKATPQPSNYRSFTTRKRLKKLVACVARKGQQLVQKERVSEYTSFGEEVVQVIYSDLSDYSQRRFFQSRRLSNFYPRKGCGEPKLVRLISKRIRLG